MRMCGRVGLGFCLFEEARASADGAPNHTDWTSLDRPAFVLLPSEFCSAICRFTCRCHTLAMPMLLPPHCCCCHRVAVVACRRCCRRYCMLLAPLLLCCACVAAAGWCWGCCWLLLRLGLLLAVAAGNKEENERIGDRTQAATLEGLYATTTSYVRTSSRHQD